MEISKEEYTSLINKASRVDTLEKEIEKLKELETNKTKALEEERTKRKEKVEELETELNNMKEAKEEIETKIKDIVGLEGEEIDFEKVKEKLEEYKAKGEELETIKQKELETKENELSSIKEKLTSKLGEEFLSEKEDLLGNLDLDGQIKLLNDYANLSGINEQEKAVIVKGEQGNINPGQGEEKGLVDLL